MMYDSDVHSAVLIMMTIMNMMKMVLLDSDSSSPSRESRINDVICVSICVHCYAMYVASGSLYLHIDKYHH